MRLINIKKTICIQLLLTLVMISHAIADERQNVIFLMTDDQNLRSLGCYAAPGVKTPNIDALAADGVVFDRHYDTTAICMACRATVMTGLPEYRHGVNFGSGDHGDGKMMKNHWSKSYPMMLRNAGYQTAFAGKFGFTVEDDSPRGRYPDKDFNVWGGGPGQTFFATAKNKSMQKYAKEFPHSTRSYGAFGRDFIKQSVSAGKEFCLSISFKAPHRPVQPDPTYDHVYANATFPKPPNFGRNHGTHFSPQSKQGRQYERFYEWHYNDQYDEVMADYYQLIYAVDVAVGMIRDALKEVEAEDNTLIIFTSDNGYLCGAHGYGSKVLPYEESSRVPLIIFDPTRKKKSNRSHALTSNLDLAATILHATLGITSHGAGQSLLHEYSGKRTVGDRLVPLINVWGPEQVYSLGFVKGDWKYIYWPYSDDTMQVSTELYNLRDDPLEMTNRIDDPKAADIRAQLEVEYDQLVSTWEEQAIDRIHYKSLPNFLRRKL